jgi:poly-gamma-glutamate synthesis protein (capsule biosynthesis protein)
MLRIFTLVISFFNSLFLPSPLLSPSASFLPSPTPTIIQIATIGLVGDLGLGRHITSTARQKNDFSWSFQGISPWLSQNDFTLANLESPIIDQCPTGFTGTFTFCGDTNFLPILSQNKLIFNLNNNHILNYGQNGLSQTSQFLPRSFYDNFYTETVNGISFGFLGYDFITYPNLDKTEIINQVNQYDSKVDYLIISIHWGNEYLPKPEIWRQNLARQLIDAGADIIHGHHPHVWQAPEIYQDRPIFYSFGNFIFDQSWSYETSHSQIVRLTLTKNEIQSISYFPVEIKFNSQPWLILPTPLPASPLP